jgi:hypothetical protein
MPDKRFLTDDQTKKRISETILQGTLISRKSNLAGKSTYKRVQCIRDYFTIIGCLALPKLKWLHWATMIWSGWINLGGFGVLVIGILLLIWSLSRGNVSAFGLALLTAGFLLQLLAAFIE